MFEVNLVAIPAAVESKKQNHRATHHGGKQDRAGWERGRRVKELTLRSLVAARDAVAQHADETASIKLSLTLINVSGRSGAITVAAISRFSASKKRVMFWLCNGSISTLSEKLRCSTPNARNNSKLPRCEPRRMLPLRLSIWRCTISLP